MEIKINATLNGDEILQYFLLKLKENNIETVWKEGQMPNGVNILITNKEGKDIAITSDKLKIIFNN